MVLILLFFFFCVDSTRGGVLPSAPVLRANCRLCPRQEGVCRLHWVRIHIHSARSLWSSVLTCLTYDQLTFVHFVKLRRRQVPCAADQSGGGPLHGLPPSEEYAQRTERFPLLGVLLDRPRLRRHGTWTQSTAVKTERLHRRTRKT